MSQKLVNKMKKMPGKAIRHLAKTQQNLEDRGQIWVDEHGAKLLIKIFGEESLKARGENLKKELVKGLTKVKDGLAKETKENKEMLNIYYRHTRGEASSEEMDKANEQFRNLMKTLGMGTLLLIPLSPITIPTFVKLGKLFDIDILPHWSKE
jgi:hypothetical protein